MGRTMKRVLMSFSWPLNKIWEGYLNPYHSEKCGHCDGSGYAETAKRFMDEWYGYVPFDQVAYGAKPFTFDHPVIWARAKRNVENAPEYYGRGSFAIAREANRLTNLYNNEWCHNLIQSDVDALVAADRLWDFTRRPLNDVQRSTCYESGWTKEPNGYHPTAEEVNLWSLSGFGHDAINCGVCIEARCKREGVDHLCPVCRGEGRVYESEKTKKRHDAWQPTEPPIGDGFQLWTTTNEGAPISPVFATIEKLCEWCEGNATTFGSNHATALEWRKMLDEDFVVHTESQGDATLIFM